MCARNVRSACGAVVGGVCSSVDLKRSVVALEPPIGELNSGNWERDGLGQIWATRWWGKRCQAQGNLKVLGKID